MPISLRPSTTLTIAAAMTAIATMPAAASGFTLGDKQINVYVAGGAGGGVDSYARTVLPYVLKHLPGQPQAIAYRNMSGGGGIQAMQYLYNVAPKDGTAIGTTNAGPVMEPLLGKVKAQYDMTKFRWIGSITQGDTICFVMKRSGITSLEDAKKREVVMGATGATSNPTRSAALTNALIGTKFRPIAGYSGGTVLIALERGEIDGYCNTLGSMQTTRPQWLADGSFVPLVQLSARPVDKRWPNLKRAVDLVKNDLDRKVLRFFGLPYDFNNPYMLPPGVPEDAVKAWRLAWSKAVKDPAYLAEAAKRNQPLAPQNGEQVEADVKELYTTPNEVVERTKQVVVPANLTICKDCRKKK